MFFFLNTTQHLEESWVWWEGGEETLVEEEFGSSLGRQSRHPRAICCRPSKSRREGKEASWLTDVEEEKLVDRKASGDKGTSKGPRTGQWGFIPALLVKQ